MSDVLPSLIPIAIVALVFGVRLLYTRARRREMERFAAAQHLRFLGRVLPPFPIPQRLETIFSPFSTFTNSITGQRREREVFCCDFLVPRMLSRGRQSGTIVAMKGEIRDPNFAPRGCSMDIVSGWTVLCSADRWSQLPARLDTPRIAAIWDDMAQSITMQTPLPNSEDNILIRPRHRTPQVMS